VEQTLLSAAFDVAVDLEFEIANAAISTVEERRFSAAKSRRMEQRFSARNLTTTTLMLDIETKWT
jgi:hypothetical protein